MMIAFVAIIIIVPFSFLEWATFAIALWLGLLCHLRMFEKKSNGEEERKGKSSQVISQSHFLIFLKRGKTDVITLFFLHPYCLYRDIYYCLNVFFLKPPTKM